MRTLKTSEAATLLNVSPNTLRSWERRFGYPKPQRSQGQHRRYSYGEIVALRDALQAGLSISSAIGAARDGLGSETSALVGALGTFDPVRADSVMESTLSLRDITRSVEDVLLPALDQTRARHGGGSAAWGFAARWSADWLRRAQRIVQPPSRLGSVVLADAAQDDLDPHSPRIRALELMCARMGLMALSLPVRATGSVADATAAVSPDVIIIAGGAAADVEVARWAYAVRAAAGPRPLLLYLRTPAGGSLNAAAARMLPDSPSAAQRHILEALRTRKTDQPMDSAPVIAPEVRRLRRRMAP